MANDNNNPCYCKHLPGFPCDYCKENECKPKKKKKD